MSDEKSYYLYILLCDQKFLYTGIAIDPIARLAQHRKGHPYGAKFTRRFKQLEIVYQIKVGSRSATQSLEIKLKKLSRKDKLRLIQNQLNLDELLIFIEIIN